MNRWMLIAGWATIITALGLAIFLADEFSKSVAP